MPIYCGPQEREPSRAPLIANLRGHVAEFLNQCSPERLRLLVSPTCVSFSTVTVLQPLGAFLGRSSDDFTNVNALEPVPWLARADLPIPHRNTVYRRFYSYGSPSKRRPSISPHQWRRNVDLPSIVYAFRPRLRYRLTLGGITFPRKP